MVLRKLIEEGGFSQGGAISLFTALSCQDKLAGFFGLSCYLLMHGNIKQFIAKGDPNKDTPVFMGHGDSDPTVKYEWGHKTSQALTELGFKVDFRTYRYDLVYFHNAQTRCSCI